MLSFRRGTDAKENTLYVLWRMTMWWGLGADKCRVHIMLSVPREGRSASWSRGGDGANTSWALLCLGLILCRLILTLTKLGAVAFLFPLYV